MSLSEHAAQLKAYTEEHRRSVVGFLRDICRIPSMDSQIRQVGERIGEEMERLGFDEVRFDRMGNILGRIGDGPVSVMFDSHIDTVGLGDESAWQWDPFEGKVEDGVLYARGACDEKGSTPGMVYGLAALKALGLHRDFTLWYFGNMEEWCDGIAPHALHTVEGVEPDYVIIGEPTKMNVYRGHRGRLEIECLTKGKACHAAMPHLGVNAIQNMARFLRSVDAYAPTIRTDPFLGRGTVVPSIIQSKSPSINAVPDECTAFLDRRMTAGETKDSVLSELRALDGADVIQFKEMYYEEPSYTGYVFKVDKYFPAWVTPADHVLVKAGRLAKETLWGDPGMEDGKWDFSTNGIYWAGKAGIPSIGFAPSNEIYAHTIEDQVPIEDAVQATSWYGLLPLALKSLGAPGRRG